MTECQETHWNVPDLYFKYTEHRKNWKQNENLNDHYILKPMSDE